MAVIGAAERNGAEHHAAVRQVEEPVHQGRIAGDGGLRDAATIGALDFPSYHARPSSPTNLTLHEAIEINCPIGCGDAAVFPEDIVVGDDDCVIIIPAAIAAEVADDAVEMTVYEDFVVEQVKAGAGIIGLYPATDPANLDKFAIWRKEQNR